MAFHWQFFFFPLSLCWPIHLNIRFVPFFLIILFLNLRSVFGQSTSAAQCQSVGQWAVWGQWQPCPQNPSRSELNVQRRTRLCQPLPVGCTQSQSAPFYCPGTYSEVLPCVITTTVTPQTTTTTTTTATTAPQTTTTTTVTPQTTTSAPQTTTTATTARPQTTTTTVTPQTTTTATTARPQTTTTTVTPQTTTTTTAQTNNTCAQWNNWMEWSACTDTCGGCGTRQRFRSCTHFVANCSCPGSAFEKVNCNLAVCVYPRQPTCCGNFTPATVNNQFQCV